MTTQYLMEYFERAVAFLVCIVSEGPSRTTWKLKVDNYLRVKNILCNESSYPLVEQARSTGYDMSNTQTQTYSKTKNLPSLNPHIHKYGVLTLSSTSCYTLIFVLLLLFTTL